MSYTPELKKLIKVVEKTRAERVERKKREEDFPPIPVDERQEILQKYHQVVVKIPKEKIPSEISQAYKGKARG